MQLCLEITLITGTAYKSCLIFMNHVFFIGK